MVETLPFDYRLIIIGLSTGGPRCIQDLFQRWTPGPKDRIVVLQHMPQAMTLGYASRLSQSLGIAVKIAESGDQLGEHLVLLCPGLHHLSFAKSFDGMVYVRVTARKMNYLYAPSIDLGFTSLASLRLSGVVGVVLTGMGNDGTQGAQKLKEAGALILTQDPEEASAPGMPSSIIEASLADYVLTIEKMAKFFAEGHLEPLKRAL